jgi:carboxymethylenebutenolidase
MYESDHPIDQLVHLYVDGGINRRELVRHVAKHTGSVAAALAALAGYQELQAQTQACPGDLRVPADASDLVMADVTFPADDGARLFGYQAWPRNATGRMPGVILVHENRGLVEHHRDLVRRIARAGFVGVAVDLLSRQGGVSQFEPVQQTQAYGRTTPYERRLDLFGTLAYIKTVPVVQFDRIGIIGFCAGGGNVWDFVLHTDELGAAVPFYGAPAPLEYLANIRTPILGIYAERDRGLTMNVLPVAQAMVQMQKVFGLFVYEGVGHGFMNDTGAAFDLAAACDAWNRAIGFFGRHLRRPGA